MNKSVALLLAIGSATANAGAQAPCEQQQSHYQQCDSQTGWYIGGAVGVAQTDIDKGRIEQYFGQNNLDINRVSIDKNDIGYNAFLGYQFNSNWAIEGGYVDFGKREVKFSGQTNDIGAYYDAAEHIYPQSADGLLVALVGSWPIAEDWKLSGKIGYTDWEGQFVTYDAQGNQGNDSIADDSILLGAELNYRLGEQTQLFAGYQRIKFNRDTNGMWSLGLRYYFNLGSSVK